MQPYETGERTSKMKMSGFWVFKVLALLALSLQGGSALSCSFGTVSNGTHCEECGVSDFTPNTKIVGGIVATANSWPWAVYVIQNVKAVVTFPDGAMRLITVRFACGGTLINRNTVVTAAHCIATTFDYAYNGRVYQIPIQLNSFYPTWESMFQLYLGVHDTSMIPYMVFAPALEAKVSKVIKHPNFNANILFNDIAVFKLTKSVQFSKYIKPACLPKSTDTTFPKPSSKVVAIGWGTTSYGGPVSALLRNVGLTVYQSSYCSSVYPGVSKNWQAQICSGEYVGGKDTCQGDAGGGLFYTDTSTAISRRVLAGITSYGYGCAFKYYPGIYTRTSYYLAWITGNM